MKQAVRNSHFVGLPAKRPAVVMTAAMAADAREGARS
jgi:hypothetical protein